jgi:hypothetical protein
MDADMTDAEVPQVAAEVHVWKAAALLDVADRAVRDADTDATPDAINAFGNIVRYVARSVSSLAPDDSNGAEKVPVDTIKECARAYPWLRLCAPSGEGSLVLYATAADAANLDGSVEETRSLHCAVVSGSGHGAIVVGTRVYSTDSQLVAAAAAYSAGTIVTMGRPLSVLVAGSHIYVFHTDGTVLVVSFSGAAGAYTLNANHAATDVSFDGGDALYACHYIDVPRRKKNFCGVSCIRGSVGTYGVRMVGLGLVDESGVTRKMYAALLTTDPRVSVLCVVKPVLVHGLRDDEYAIMASVSDTPEGNLTIFTSRIHETQERASEDADGYSTMIRVDTGSCIGLGVYHNLESWIPSLLAYVQSSSAGQPRIVTYKYNMTSYPELRIDADPDEDGLRAKGTYVQTRAHENIDAPPGETVPNALSKASAPEMFVYSLSANVDETGGKHVIGCGSVRFHGVQF